MREPKRDASGNIIVRLKDKPAIEYDELPPEVQTVLRGMGITDKAAWDDRKEKLCRFCGPLTDHYWSRCFKLFITTTKGQKFLDDREKGRNINTQESAINAAWALECLDCDDGEVEDISVEELQVFQVTAREMCDNWLQQ
jgi:hypothetical protein